MGYSLLRFEFCNFGNFGQLNPSLSHSQWQCSSDTGIYKVEQMLTRDANRRQGNVEQARGAQYEFYKNISRLNFQKHTILCYFRVTLGGMQCLIHFSLSGARPQTHVMS